MKITCSLTGIPFEVSGFPFLGTHDPSLVHPIFLLPLSKLRYSYRVWVEDYTLSSAEIYLLICALLNHTGALTYSHQITCTTEAPEYLASTYLFDLMELVEEISSISHPRYTLPKIAVTQVSHELKHLLQVALVTWEEYTQDFIATCKESIDLKYSKPKRVRDWSASSSVLNSINRLASWAVEACRFPAFEVTLAHKGGKKVSCASYWVEIIKCAHNDDKLILMPKEDIEELIEHIEIECVGNAEYKKALLHILNKGLKAREQYFGEGVYDLSTEAIYRVPIAQTFTILAEGSSEEDAARANALLNAPSQEPKKENYSSLVLYLRDLGRWNLKQSKLKSEAEGI